MRGPGPTRFAVCIEKSEGQEIKTKSLFALVALALSLGPAANKASAEHYKIWLKAFIPNSGLDIVAPVPNSTDQSMIPGPSIMGIPADSTCYNTNNRSFSSSPDSEAKITIVTEFDVLSPGVSNFVSQTPEIGSTIRYDCSDGSVLGTKQASTENISVGTVSYSQGVVSYDINAEAANPFIPLPSSIAPSIKMHGTVTVDTNTHTVSFAGTVAKFPSYEAYLSLDNSNAVTIFNISPASDATAWSLVFNVSLNPSVSY